MEQIIDESRQIYIEGINAVLNRTNQANTEPEQIKLPEEHVSMKIVKV